MAGKTGIAWTNFTWNPLAGCSIVSPACTHCYAMAQAARIESMGTSPHYIGLTKQTKTGAVWTGKVVRAPDHVLTQPMRWTRPRKIFVNSMSDLFHETVSDETIDRIFAVMALSPRHIFQILTKRSARMRQYLCGPWQGDGVAARIADASLEFVPYGKLPTGSVFEDRPVGQILANGEPEFGYRRFLKLFPLSNVWLGTTVEDQPRADERIPDLLACPAAIRFISCEPLLGRINLTSIPVESKIFPGNHDLGEDISCLRHMDSLRGIIGWVGQGLSPIEAPDETGLPHLDQVIVGGESGPKARHMDPDDARYLRDQCSSADISFFMKQMSGSKRIDREAIPGDLEIREFPQ